MDCPTVSGLGRGSERDGRVRRGGDVSFVGVVIASRAFGLASHVLKTIVLPPCVVLAGMLPVEGYLWTDRCLTLRAGMVIFGYRFVVYRFCLIAVFYVERLLLPFAT